MFKTVVRCSKWRVQVGPVNQYVNKKKSRTNLLKYGLNKSFIVAWKVVGVLMRLKGTTKSS